MCLIRRSGETRWGTTLRRSSLRGRVSTGWTRSWSKDAEKSSGRADTLEHRSWDGYEDHSNIVAADKCAHLCIYVPLLTPLTTQACTGHPGALWEKTGESQQPVHGAQCYHAAAGDQRERAAQVRKHWWFLLMFFQWRALRAVNCIQVFVPLKSLKYYKKNGAS